MRGLGGLFDRAVRRDRERGHQNEIRRRVAVRDNDRRPAPAALEQDLGSLQALARLLALVVHDVEEELRQLVAIVAHELRARGAEAPSEAARVAGLARVALLATWCAARGTREHLGEAHA